MFMATLPVDWKLNFTEAKVQAESDHKMILLNFSGSDWCGPCIKLKKEVFESSAFQQYASEKLVLVKAVFQDKKRTSSTRHR